MKLLGILLTSLICTELYPTFGANARPTRIVSTAGNVDEILWDMVPASQRNHIVGFSSVSTDDRYSYLPKIRTGVPAVATDGESILALKPDLVLTSPFNRPEFITQLESLKLKVIVTRDPKSVADIYDLIGDIATAVGFQDEGKSLVSSMKAQIKTMQSLSQSMPSRPRVLLYAGDLNFPGEETLINEVIQISGGRNAMSEIGIKGWQNISEEKLAPLNPDLIVCPGQLGSRETILKTLHSMPATRNWRAVSKSRIVIIPGASLYSTSHHVIDAIARLQSEISSYVP